MAEAPRIVPNERATAEKMQNAETLAISEKFLETLELSEHIKMQSNAGIRFVVCILPLKKHTVN